MGKDSLLLNLVLAALATLPTYGFINFLAAHCEYYNLPQPLRVNMAERGEKITGTPKDLWENGGPKQRMLLVMAIDEALQDMLRKRAN